MISKKALLLGWGQSLLTLLLAVVVVYYALELYTANAERAQATNPSAEVPPVNVETMRIQTHDMEDKLIFNNATVSPRSSVKIMPKANGILEKLQREDGTLLSEGVEVRAGEIIANLDDLRLQADVAQAKAALEVAKSAVLIARVDLADAAREKLRQTQLWNQGAGTQQELDKSCTTYDRAVANLSQIQANVLQAEAALKQKQVMLDETIIRAPHDGLITEKQVDPGTYVTPASALVTLVEMKEMKILITVPQAHLPKIQSGKTQVRVSSELWDAPQIVPVEKIYPSVDPVTRVATVELVVPNKKENDTWIFRPGMYLTCAFLVHTKKAVPAVSQDLLRRDIDRYLLFKVMPDDTVQACEVQLGIRDGSNVEILSGISPGDEVVCSGQFRLTDGSKIKRVVPGETAVKKEPAL